MGAIVFSHLNLNIELKTFSLPLSCKKTALELGKARRCAEIVSGNAAGARLWDKLPVPAGGAFFLSFFLFRCLERSSRFF